MILRPDNLSIKFFLKACARKFNAQKHGIEKFSPDNSSIKMPEIGQKIIRRRIIRPNEKISGEEFAASRDFFRAKNYPAKKTPSEEYS
jgi:hypothetical protein